MTPGARHGLLALGWLLTAAAFGLLGAWILRPTPEVRIREVPSPLPGTAEGGAADTHTTATNSRKTDACRFMASYSLTGALSRLAQRYQHATDRYGRHASPRRVSRSGLGSARNP